MYLAITSFVGVAAGELAFQTVSLLSAILQILVLAFAFSAGWFSVAILRPVREAMKDSKKLLRSTRGMSLPQLVENLD